MSQILNNQQLRKLKAAAQSMTPDLKMGKNGLSEAFMKMVELELNRKEMIKIKFEEMKDKKKELAAELTEKSGAQLVMQVGHVVVLFRRNEDLEKQVIKL